MWDTSGEPPGEKEGGSSDSVMQAPETCEPKSPVESLEETLTKSKPSSKKQEEVQEYARRLSKIKSRTKLSRRNKEGNVPPRDTSHTSDATFSDTADSAGQAKTAKAKSTLLQKKLAEDRKVFEQRNKERTETKRAVEEKVEAIRQQLDEKDVSHSDLALMNVQKDQLSVTPIKPVMITSEVMSPVQIETIREKEIKIAELNNKIVELEASIVDLQENLKEKDSVIESKTKAVTLMSADLSKKGKTTLDTLEDTKDEMRTMQQHFVLMESSLKSKNENLLMQLQERDNKITELEESLNRYEQEVNKQKLSESASADFSRSTMDTLVETKEAMKSMQENFVLIESSLKAKNDNLLQQLQDYEIKLAEANQRIFKFESGAGIERDPAVDDLQYKLGKLENSHKQLQDEKYELQKSVADLQDKIVNISAHGNNGAVIEKDNRIVELENLVEELKQSNKLLEEESKVELQKLLADMTLKNEEYANKITDLENLVHKLEEEKSDIAARLPDESTVNKDEKVSKLTKELEDLNRSMIKIKAQHKSKIKNLQKQLEGFKMVSDTNAELVRLANQVALLEEEKGNLQLNLVDFDELKASAGDWQEQIVYLESKVSDQAKEIEMQIEAIAALENQKLDLMQELHMAKQEVSSLEAENAESENLRVTAEMKVVDFEEQLEALQKLQNENNLKSSLEENQAELIRRIEVLTQENTDLYSRISKMEEKGAYDTGSTESFEAIQEMDKGDLLKKVEDLIQKNNELTLKLNKVQEVGNSHAGSTESFETINETDKNELLKKIDQLTQENTDLTMKLSRIEEKGSSDTGSTESFDRIPEHNESTTKIDLLTQENNELVIKLTKLEEHLENIESNRKESKSDEVLKLKVDSLLEENNNQSVELSNLRAQLLEITLENTNLQKQIEILTAEVSTVRSEDLSEKSKREIDLTTQIDVLLEEKVHLEKEIKELRNTLEKSREVTSEDSETSHLSSRVEELLKENEKMLGRMSELERLNEKLKEDLATVMGQKDELYQKINQILPDEPATEGLEFLEKLEKLNKEKQQLNEQVETLLEKLNKHVSDDQALDKSIVATLEQEIGEAKKMLLEQTGIIGELEIKLASKQNELEEKDKAIRDYHASEQRIESLEVELTEMREKLHGLSIEKALIEEEFNKLQKENGVLLEEKQAKDAENNLLKQQFQDITTSYESKIQTQLAAISEKENDIVNLKEIIQEKDQELHAKYTELQNKMIAIDEIQDELTNLKISIQEKDALLMSTSEEIANLNNVMRSKEEEIASLRREVSDFNEKVEESKPLKDYNELLEQLKNKDMILDETQYRINATTKENSNLLEKVKDLSQLNDEMEQRLSKTQQELSNVLAAKEHLDVEFAELKNGKDQDEKRIQELQNSSLYYTRFVEDLQEELSNAYKQIEQLKLKHTEDMELQNQRIENLITDLQSKTQEYETLHSELLEKDRLVGQNVTEEVKIALEAKVAEMEQKLKNSEEKIQMQLERMKKIAANLKKKSAVCQELETRVRELEEKWMTEKDEKEAKNKQIQDVEILMREKDNQIADLEEKLMQAKSESAEAFTNINKLTSDLTNSKEKMSLLVQQMTEIEEETVRVKTELDSLTAELATEKEMKQNVISDYETYKQEIAKENERKQLELDEVKEQARELSVRMQVMEAEYVEQLATIKNLIAENALLSSKQSQINEKLENVEKESEDRRVLLEQMQKETNTTTVASTQTVEEEVGEDESKIPGTQHCNHCEQCQTVVQALEAKLQEQEAEIDNLDNELANSIGTLVHMRESIRYNDLMNQTAMRNRSLEDPYNELMLQYDALASNHEEVKAKLDEALKENKELLEKIEGLQSTNATLEENLAAAEQALEANKLENVDFLNSELMKKCEVSESKLLNVQQQLQHIQEHAAQLEHQLQSQTSLLKSEEEQRMQAEQLLENAKSNYAQEITSLKADQNATEKTVEDLRLELEAYKNQSESCVEKSISKREVSPRDFAANERDNVPQLFDATKIFGTTSVSDSNLLGDAEVQRLQALLCEKEAQYSNLTQEVSELQRQIIEERSQMSQNYSQCVVDLETSKKELFAAQENLERVEHLLTEKDRHIESLNADLRNLSSQQAEELAVNAAKEAIEKLIVERDQQNVLLESCKLQISTLEGELRNSTDSELIQDLESRISNITKERDLLQLQVSDLTRSLEKMKNSTERGNSNLQIEIERMARERDEAKEMVANLTRSLEDAYKAAEKTPTITDSSTKESTPLEESVFAHTEPDSSKLAVRSVQELTVVSDAWDAGSSEKLNVDEETWGWNEEDAELVGGQVSTTLVPSTEIQLRAQVEDLQDRIRDLENEKDRLTEENKHIQLRSGKMIKKLKEYKVQVENLQQQLKIQKSTSDFYELDSAIEEELKSQINKLEKALNEVKEEQKNMLVEKDALTKRLDILVAANERYMEMKERQCMDMEVLRIRNKELSDKVQFLENSLQKSAADVEESDAPREEGPIAPEEETKSVDRQKILVDRQKRSVDGEDLEVLCKKYKDEVDDLKDEMEALAAENEQLQHFLEEQKEKLSALESKRTADENESIQIVEDLNKRISELQSMLSKSREEYELLRKQYEQSLMDANDQVSAMRQNADFLKEETFDKISKLEMNIADLHMQLEASESNAKSLQTSLQEAVLENTNLKEKLSDATALSDKQLSCMNASMAEVTELLNVRIQEVADLKQALQKQYIDHEEVNMKLQESMQQQNQEIDENLQQVKRLEAALEASVNTCSLEKEQELDLLRRILAERESAQESLQLNLASLKEQLLEKELQASQNEKTVRTLSIENKGYVEAIEDLQKRLKQAEEMSSQMQDYVSRIQSLEQELEGAKATLVEKETALRYYTQESAECKLNLESSRAEINECRTELQKADALRNELLEKTEQINRLSAELQAVQVALNEARENLSEKGTLLEKSTRKVDEMQIELNRLSAVQQEQPRQSSSEIIDGLPVFRMGDNSDKLQQMIDSMQAELDRRQEEIDHFKYLLNENTYPSIIQEMQNRIDGLYNEKADLTYSLETAALQSEEKDKQIDSLMQRIETQSQELVSKEDATVSTKVRRSVEDQEEIVQLQNDLHVKEQEINELKYMIAEKDSQLSLQASMEPQSDEFELREMVQRLTTELYAKEQEIQQLKLMIAGLQQEVARLQDFERLSDETRNAIQRLDAEKEQVRLQAQEFLEQKLKEKEAEINEIKERLSIENSNILGELRLRNTDIENMKIELEDCTLVERRLKDMLNSREDELIQMSNDLAEKERRLAELSITKDTELHVLKVLIHEKDVRIEELLALSDEEEKQLKELKNTLEARETEIISLKTLLEDKVKEYELIQNVLKKDVPIMDASAVQSAQASGEESRTSTSQELDLALYMLHQRDVRCEELTHELMQLLEERDTLQLRLSNAIRVNEELRKGGSPDVSLTQEPSVSGSSEPLIEHPSPSKSEGPVEIAKEAIDAPIGEDKDTLALKLSQLHTVSHAKDVRLRDERELRHTQQMSLLAHKDVLSTLPPEAAARLVNANYTLSRDVQSQSSVLLNWLWGKSTPKVVHM